MNTDMSVDIQRAAYMRAWALVDKMLKAKNPAASADDFFIEPHTLILSGTPTSSGRIEWGTENGDNQADASMQILLKKADAVVVWGLGLALTKVDPANAEFGSYPLVTYPEATIFDGVAASGQPEAKSLMNIYRGKMSLKTSNTDRLSDFSSDHFLVTPERIAPDATIGQLPVWGPTLEREGIFLLQPMPLLNGDLDNKFRLDFGKGSYDAIEGKVTAAGAVTTVENRVQLRVHGWKIANVVKSFTTDMEAKGCNYV